MKKLATSLMIALFSFGFLLAIAPAAQAYSPFSEACSSKNGLSTDSSVVCGSKNSTADPVTGSSGVLIKATNAVAMVAGIAAVFLLVVSGVRFIISGGDPAKVTQAKNTILYTVVGLVVIALARTVIIFIINKI